MSCAKTAGPIEMPFGLYTRVGPRNHIVGEGLFPPWARVNFLGRLP